MVSKLTNKFKTQISGLTDKVKDFAHEQKTGPNLINLQSFNQNMYGPSMFSKFINGIKYIKYSIEGLSSLMVSLITIFVVFVIVYFISKLYNRHSRPFQLNNFLQISGNNDGNVKALEKEFYTNLAKGITNYIYNINILYDKNLFNPSIDEKKARSYIDAINNKIFFQQRTDSYKQLTSFITKYKTDKVNSKDDVNKFVYDILVNKKNTYKTAKKELITILKTYKAEFKTNLYTANNTSIMSFINTPYYLKNLPQNDYILSSYGKFATINNNNINEIKSVGELLNIKDENINTLLTKKVLDNKSFKQQITNEINEYLLSYDDIYGEPFENYIVRQVCNDVKEFDEYNAFLTKYQYSGNELVDRILNLSGKRNLSIDKVQNSFYNKDVATASQKSKIIVFEDLIIFGDYKNKIKQIENNFDDLDQIHNIFVTYSWYLQRLANAQVQTNNGSAYILGDDKKKKFNNITSHIYDTISFSVYKTEIGIALFVVLYFYLKQDSFNEKIKALSDFYMSFSELYLGANQIEQFEGFKSKREKISILEQFIAQPFKYYFTKTIWQNNIKKIGKNYSHTILPMWNNFIRKFSSPVTYFDCSNSRVRKAINECKVQTFVNDTDKPDVIEGFSFNKIIKVFTDFGKMIGSLFKLVVQLIKLLALAFELISHPMEFFRIFISAIVWFFAKFVSIILEIKVAKKPIGYLIISFFYRVLYLLPVALANSAIFALLLFPRLVFGFIAIVFESMIPHNLISRSIYRYFIACEDSPNSWYENSFYQTGNKYTKQLLCSRKCMAGYKLSEDGSTCIKIPSHIPNYCENAELMRIYRGLPLSGTTTLTPFKPPINFGRMSDEQKQAYINVYKADKKEYFESCQNKTMNQYDEVAKNICSNIDYTSGTSNSAMKQICFNKYCSNGQHEPFCQKISNVGVVKNQSIDESSLVKNVSLYCLILSGLALSLYQIDKTITTLRQ